MSEVRYDLTRFDEQGSTIRVISTASHSIRFWDGLRTDDWVQQRLHALETTFATYTPVRFAFMTYNVGAASPHLLQTSTTPASQTLLHDFLTSLQDPDVIAFGFQEVIDLSNLSLAADIVLFASEHHEVSANYRKWRTALSAAVARVLGSDYVMVVDAKLVGVSREDGYLVGGLRDASLTF